MTNPIAVSQRAILLSELTESVLSRFYAKFERGDDSCCWPWVAAKSNSGYGRFYISKGRMVTATRLAWMIANQKDWPEDRLACHTCDNPICVNPSHIWAGTLRENAIDSIQKGRQPRVLKEFCSRGHDIRGQDRLSPSSQHRCRECVRETGRIRARRFKARRKLAAIRNQKDHDHE